MAAKHFIFSSAGMDKMCCRHPSMSSLYNNTYTHLATDPFHRRSSENVLQSVHATFPLTQKKLKGQSLKVKCSIGKQAQTLQTSSMEETYDALAMRLLMKLQGTKSSEKFLVGLAGPPGAGKSTVATEVVNRLNNLWDQNNLQKEESGRHEIAIAVPMDGFHLYRWQLDAFEDPVGAHARRGAPWTFDPAGLVKCLSDVRKQGHAHFPSFDHSVGDPIENDIFVSSFHRVVLVEGNYLLLSDGQWQQLASIFDELWFIEVDIDEAMRRVERRHVLTGKTPEHATWRVEYNDRPNAEMIIETKKHADLVIRSIPI